MPTVSWAIRGYEELMGQLAPIGRDAATGGYNRLSWTAADRELQDWFRGVAEDMGLLTEQDGNGNLWAWWGKDLPGTALVVGSHLDSVPDGGAYDGPLGVVGALLAIRHAREDGFVPSRPIAVVAFSDEEGGRFGIACAGSRLLTGALHPEVALALVDREGTTLADALSAAGRSTTGLGPDPDRLARIGAFVELHIEQGHFATVDEATAGAVGLTDAGSSLGVATEIWPHGRWRIEIDGEANHAGATRMEDRNDPLLPAAAAVLEVERAAREHQALGTVGRLEVVPGAVNAIASRARLWMDVRGADEGRVRAVVSDVGRVAGHEPVQESWTGATPFDSALTARVAAVAARITGEGIPHLPCGAGHDAGILALAGVPSAMIFVRNTSGASHAPREEIEPADAAIGILALEALVRELGGSPE